MLTYASGRLCVEGRPLEALVRETGTPCFLMSEARLRANYGALVRGLSRTADPVTVRYCVKTNNEAGVLEVLARSGSHALASHPAEVRLALACGFRPERIAYQCPVLREEEVRAVLGEGVALVHAYRLKDLDVIESAAARLGRTARVSLRLRSGRFRLSPLGFLSRRLGFHESQILPAAERIRSSTWLALAAINFYLGTQQESADNYGGLLRTAMRLASEIHLRTGTRLDEINLGGGVPSPSLRRMGLRTLWGRVRDDLAWDPPGDALEAFAHGLSSRFRQAVEEAGLDPLPGLALEPGRSIVGNAGVLVTRVLAVEGRWAFLDASHNHLGESTLLFARRILPEREAGPGPQRYYHLSGGTLNTRDVIDLRRRLRPLSEGDLLALADAGAYSISRASRYAGVSPAVHLLGEDGTLRTIRRAEGLQDLAGPMATADGRRIAGG